ncbi:MAG: hypothetical protein Q9166_001809 [cf. Caloplaca sp. 2 TL-2023]
MLPILILALVLSSACPSVVAQTLPVFPVRNNFQGESRAHELIKYLYNNAGNSAFGDSRLIIKASDNSSTVEIDTLSGGIWSADNTRLWNTSLARKPEEFGKLKEGTKLAADRLIKELNLLPRTDKGSAVTFEFGGTSGTQLAREDGLVNSTDIKRQNFQLDISANYHAKLTLSNLGNVPIVGGGGKFQYTFDNSNRLIGHHGTWREVQGKGIEFPVIAQNISDAQFAEATKGLKNLNFNSSLAYYSAPFGQVQNYLYPVYVYHATAMFGNEMVELRETMLPATTFGTEIQGLGLRPGCGAPKETKPKPEPVSKGPGSKANAIKRRTRAERRGFDDRSWELGTEWLGQPFGLSLTQANAAGIRSLLFDFTFGLFFGIVQWIDRFDFGDNLVWESDWNRADDVYVDTVDLMFYTGHASGNGWVTATHGTDPTTVDTSIVGTFPESPGDLWGQLDMEWLVIAACGPHQDDGFVAGGGNAFDRWRGVFDGLHVFMGYGSVSADTAEEGKRFVRYAIQDATIVNSWFRTAKEVQNSGVWVTAMWAGDAGQDHLPGHGSMAADPATSAQRFLMWSQV